MSVTTLTGSGGATRGFRHEALLYDGDEGFLDSTVPFIVDGLVRNEPVMVAVSDRRIQLLRDNLGWDRHWVDFVDMSRLGRNPGRIISAWQRFVSDHRDHHPHLRGIGEPLWPERTPSEVIECQHHELLLNAAFGDGRPWHLLCPYDRSTLDPAIIQASTGTHPHLHDGGPGEVNADYRGDDQAFSAVLDGVLPEPGVPYREVVFGIATRAEVGRVLAEETARLSPTKAAELARCVDEVVDNSIRHGGGRGTARIWHDDGLVCEVRDDGHIDDPLIGRGLGPTEVHEGRGLWLVHALCDLVELRSSATGTVVRMSVRYDHP